HLIGIWQMSTAIVFSFPVMLFEPTGDLRQSVLASFPKLHTPIHTETELGAVGFPGRGQLALVGKVTTGMGLACFLIVVLSSPGRDRMITAIYAVVTTLVGLAFVAAGRSPQSSAPIPNVVEPRAVVEE